MLVNRRCCFFRWKCPLNVWHACSTQFTCNAIILVHKTWWMFYGTHVLKDGCPSDLQTNSVTVPRERFFLLDDLSLQDKSNMVLTKCNNGDLDKACSILSSSNNWNVIARGLEQSAIHFNPEIVSAILHHCQKHGCMALHFFSWLENLEGYVHNTKTYNMAIKIAGSAKDFKHMRNLYLQMKRQRCPITPDTWNIVIAQYGQAGLTEMALKKFSEMKVEGYQPNASTYKFLIIFLCGKKGRKVDKAIQIFQEMVRSGYLPDNEMIEIYLLCLCESKKILEAKRSVKLLCRNGLSVQVTKSMFIRSLSRAGRLEAALEVSNQLKQLGHPKTKYIYGSLVHGLLRAGRLDDAIMEVKEMEQSGIPCTVHIYTSLIIHYLCKKQIDKANSTFDRMIESGCLPTVVTYSAYIHGLVSNGMILDACNIFNKMKIDGPLPDFKTYSMFIASLCKAGMSEKGLLLLHEMSSKEIFPSAINFRTVFHGLNREGKHSLAESVLRMKWDLSRKRKFLR